MTDQLRHQNGVAPTVPLNPAVAVPNLPLNDLHILLVDDCEDNQFLFKRVLVRKGARVSLASNGVEGLELIATNSFDVVLLDIQMPVMDGFEMMEQLIAQHFKAPVIALTGFNRECEKKNILVAGFTSIVSKPLDATLLVEAISESIKAFAQKDSSNQ